MSNLRDRSSWIRRAMVKPLAATTAVLVLVLLGATVWHASIFAAYSREFGTLSQARFESSNARMDALGALSRASAAALAAVDAALIVVAIRTRAYLALAFGIVVAAGLALSLLAAEAAVGGGMLG